MCVCRLSTIVMLILSFHDTGARFLSDSNLNNFEDTVKNNLTSLWDVVEEMRLEIAALADLASDFLDYPQVSEEKTGEVKTKKPKCDDPGKCKKSKKKKLKSQITGKGTRRSSLWNYKLYDSYPKEEITFAKCEINPNRGLGLRIVPISGMVWMKQYKYIHGPFNSSMGALSYTIQLLYQNDAVKFEEIQGLLFHEAGDYTRHVQNCNDVGKPLKTLTGFHWDYSNSTINGKTMSTMSSKDCYSTLFMGENDVLGTVVKIYEKSETDSLIYDPSDVSTLLRGTCLGCCKLKTVERTEFYKSQNSFKLPPISTNEVCYQDLKNKSCYCHTRR